MSRCLLANPLPSHLHPPSRRPPPSARDAGAPPGAQSCGRTRQRRRRRRWLPQGGCDSLTGAIDGRRRGFHGGIYLWRDRTAAIKKRERRARGRARKSSLPAPPLRPLSWGAPGPDRLPSPTLPRSPPLLNPPARPRGTLAGLFRESVKAVGLSMETGTLFDSVEEEDLLFSNSE